MAIIRGDFTKKKIDARKKGKEQSVPLYQFHVSLAFSSPLIWRRIQVPGNMTLKQFHKVLQLSMGWTGQSNHQFYVGKAFYNSGLSAGDDPAFYEGDFELQDLEEKMKWCFTYMYDAGDGWEHEIVLEETGNVSKESREPQLLDGEWASPPEEIGSVHIYEEVLWALENPKEKGSQNLIDHHGVDGFDPYSFDHQKINQELGTCNWAASRS